MSDNRQFPVPTPLPVPKERNLRPPWAKGQSGNPSGIGGLYREAQQLAREASPRAVGRLIELVESEDERVASVAANSLLDRAWGKPKEFDPREIPPSGMRLDVDKLTPEQRDFLLNLIQSGAVKPAEGG